MSFLIDSQLKEMLLNDPPLVENLIDPEIQVQPNSLEMTVSSVMKINGTGAIDFDNSERRIPDSKKLEFDENGWINLSKGIYKVIFNEIVNIPENVGAIARPRSTLVRSGVTLGTTVWDSGYRGRSECLLVVHNPEGFLLKKNARIIQLLFFKTEKNVENTYSGIYMNENIKKT